MSNVKSSYSTAKGHVIIHRLKTWPVHFSQILEGKKTCEVRKNDRNFRVGDELLLQEYAPENYWDPGDPVESEYTGRILHRRITHILKGEDYGIKNGYVVLSIEKL